MAPASIWRIGPVTLALDEPRLIGVLNVTPDSFSDGGEFAHPDDAAARGLRLAADGACIIDVGAESSRPGACRVPAAEQIRRAVPVIERLRGETGAILSIDTTLAAVAEAALDAGAAIINDVSAGTEDAMLDLAAHRRCGLVLMHRRVQPARDSYSDRYRVEPVYDDVVAEVGAYLGDRCRAAIDRGVEPASIAIDPGLGFGKSVEQNFELIRRAADLVATGHPVVSAASRKSFLGAVTGEPQPRRRDAASAAVSVVHWLAGVRLFRVHDVATHRAALGVAATVRQAACQPV